MSSEEMLARQMWVNIMILDLVIINIRERLENVCTRYWL